MLEAMGGAASLSGARVCTPTFPCEHRSHLAQPLEGGGKEGRALNTPRRSCSCRWRDEEASRKDGSDEELSFPSSAGEGDASFFFLIFCFSAVTSGPQTAAFLCCALVASSSLQLTRRSGDLPRRPVRIRLTSASRPAGLPSCDPVSQPQLGEEDLKSPNDQRLLKVRSRCGLPYEGRLVGAPKLPQRERFKVELDRRCPVDPRHVSGLLAPTNLGSAEHSPSSSHHWR